MRASQGGNTIGKVLDKKNWKKMQLDVEESTPASDFTPELQLAIANMLFITNNM